MNFSEAMITLLVSCGAIVAIVLIYYLFLVCRNYYSTIKENRVIKKLEKKRLEKDKPKNNDKVEFRRSKSTATAIN